MNLRPSKHFMNFPSIKNKKNYTAALFLLLLIAACTKISTTTIGNGLIPPVDGVNTFDTTLEIAAKNTNFDTVAVGIADDNIIGYVNDPLFGKTAASVAVQMLPPFFKYSFEVSKDSLFIDSVVLSLGYRGFWGDSTKPVSLHVYRMEAEQNFKKDSVYKNTKSFKPYGLELNDGNIARTFYIRDILADTIYRNSIRIKLNNSFGTELLHYDSTNAYQNDSLFNVYVKGLIVESEQTGNTIIRTNLLDTGTKLILYYRYNRRDSAGKQDTTARSFIVSPYTSAHCNMITRDRSGAEIAQYLPSNPDEEDDKIYIQSQPGTYSILKVKGLTGLPNMIVHRAEVIMEQIPDYTSSYDDLFGVPNLFLSGVNDTIRFAIPPSDPYDIYHTPPSPVVALTGQGISNLGTFGCFPKTKADPVSGKNRYYYTFDITRYVQAVATRDIDTIRFALWAPYGGYIKGSEVSPYYYPISSPTLNYPAIGRVRLGGGNNADYKMRLHIIYSKP